MPVFLCSAMPVQAQSRSPFSRAFCHLARQLLSLRGAKPIERHCLLPIREQRRCRYATADLASGNSVIMDAMSHRAAQQSKAILRFRSIILQCAFASSSYAVIMLPAHSRKMLIRQFLYPAHGVCHDEFVFRRHKQKCKRECCAEDAFGSPFRQYGFAGADHLPFSWMVRSLLYILRKWNDARSHNATISCEHAGRSQTILPCS